jgi:hypothetical protein
MRIAMGSVIAGSDAGLTSTNGLNWDLMDKNEMRSLRTVVIIGAPRSGTNMLRDVLCRLPGYATWPCDEINPIWRHGNTAVETDTILPEHATTEVRRYIGRCFAGIATRYGANTVVEKTCANSLRVPFVDKVLPEARYLFITRDGYDAASSAMLRWTGSTSPAYVLRKARFVPLTDLPGYALSFLKARLNRVGSAEHRLGGWGPVWPGMPDLRGPVSLEELCAAQWSECVKASVSGFRAVQPERVCHLTYESFVAAPIEALENIVEFLDDTVDRSDLMQAVAGVRSDSPGKARARLDPRQLAAMRPLVDQGEFALADAGWLSKR